MLELNNKIKKILYVGSKSQYGYTYQNWYFALEEICDKLISYDPHWNTMCFGEEIMNKTFLKYIEKEKPDIIFFLGGLIEFSFDSLLKIREINPVTQTIATFGDEDIFFEGLYSYLPLFFDFILTGEKKYLSRYSKLGFKNIFYITGINTRLFRPLNLEKRYDVVFIGHPTPEKSGRYETIKFLKDNNVNITLFGRAWENYPEFKEIYKGVLTNERMIEIINQSKIILGLSRSAYGELQLKGKVFENAACKAFNLVEYYEEYLDFFNEEKEIVLFKDKRDLLEKINYFLKHEEERKKIAEASYKKLLKYYNFDVELRKVINKVYSKKKLLDHRKLPSINKKIISLSEKDLKNSIKSIKEKICSYDYLTFSLGFHEDFKYRKYIQTYTLEKSKKPISLCNYAIHNKHMGDYLVLDIRKAFKTLSEKDFYLVINLNQIMVKKEFFLNNFKKFKKLMENEKIYFINQENTIFIFSPLIRLNKIPIKNYGIIKRSFNLKFIHQLYSLKYRRRFLLKYLPAFLFEILKGNLFLLKGIIDALKDKDRRNMLKRYERESKN